MIGFLPIAVMFLGFIAAVVVIGGNQNRVRPPDTEVDFRKPWHFDSWGRGSGHWEPIGVEVRRNFGRTEVFIKLRSKRKSRSEMEHIKIVPIENFEEVSSNAPQNL